MELNAILALFVASQNLPLSSEKAHELFADFFDAIIKHLKADDEALATFTSQLASDVKAFDLSDLKLTDELTAATLNLMAASEQPIATVIPQIQKWLREHEALAAHKDIHL